MSTNRPDNPERQGSSSSRDVEQGSGDPDFGSFVSSSANKSFRQLKKDRGRADSSRGHDRTSRDFRRRLPASEQTTPEPPIDRTRPIGRKWRDAAGVPADDYEETDSDQVESGLREREGRPAFSSRASEAGDWARASLLTDGKPNRTALAILVGLLIILLVILFLAVQGGGDNAGDDDGNTIMPTETVPNVITTDRTSTPSADNASPPPGSPGTGTNQETPEPTTQGEDGGSDVIEGGDNQRD